MDALVLAGLILATLSYLAVRDARDVRTRDRRMVEALIRDVQRYERDLAYIEECTQAFIAVSRAATKASISMHEFARAINRVAREL